MQHVFLLPGEMHFARDPTGIATLLGSCVAMVVQDSRRGWGGMNHFLLPEQLGSSSPLPAGKFGDLACAHLLKLATLSGCAPDDLHITLVGGGNVTGGNSVPGGLADIGGRNIEAARAFCARHSLRVVRQDVAGRSGRRVHLDTGSGRIDIVRIEDLHQGRSRRKLGVLVVDDSVTLRRVVCAAIAGAEDLEVCGEAGDPFEAREHILARDPDVILLDLVMPNLDGLSFLRRLMQFKPTPTIVLSSLAKPGSDSERLALAAGAVGVFDKEDLALSGGIDKCRDRLLPALRKAALRR